MLFSYFDMFGEPTTTTTTTRVIRPTRACGQCEGCGLRSERKKLAGASALCAAGTWSYHVAEQLEKHAYQYKSLVASCYHLVDGN